MAPNGVAINGANTNGVSTNGAVNNWLNRNLSYPPRLHTLAFTTLDVFTNTPYSGNPLALIRVPAALRSSITQHQKQQIAREFNLSETIFLHEQQHPDVPEWAVDIFTTDAELPFAGHPTIGAAAYILSLNNETRWREGTLITKAGPIPVSLKPQNAGVMADIPHNVHIHTHTLSDLSPTPYSGLSQVPQIREAELRAPIVSIVKGMTFLLVELPSLDLLAQVQRGGEIDFHGVLDKEGWNVTFVAKYYFVVLRNENEGEGVDGGKEETVHVRTRMVETGMEDPATGSAASALGCWLSLREGRGRRFEIEQGVEMGRSSGIGVEVGLGSGKGRGRVESVRLIGCAVVVMEGLLRI